MKKREGVPMMSYKQFEKTFPNAVREALPEEYHDCPIRLSTDLNGNRQFTFDVGKSAPTIITADWYCLMIDKDYSVEEVAKYAADWFAKVVKLGISLHDLEKDNIFPVLINKEASEKLKGTAPMRPFLDLMIGFRIILDPEPQQPGKEIRTAELNYGTLQTLGITEEELWKDYINNFPEILSPGYVSMSSIFGGDLRFPMYVISNSVTLYGSSAILTTDLLDELCNKMGCDSLMLFPSSVHEVLALDGALRGAYELMDMLCSVNQNRTAPQDRLSSHPYLYANGVISSIEDASKDRPN